MSGFLKSLCYHFAALVITWRTGKKHTVRKTVIHGAIINGVFQTDVRSSADLVAESLRTGKPMIAKDYQSTHTTWKIVPTE